MLVMLAWLGLGSLGLVIPYIIVSVQYAVRQTIDSNNMGNILRTLSVHTDNQTEHHSPTHTSHIGKREYEHTVRTNDGLNISQVY